MAGRAPRDRRPALDADSAHDRLREFVDAVPGMAAYASLTDLLPVLVDLAAKVIGCDYAAIRLPGDGRAASLFVVSSAVGDSTERAGPMPGDLGVPVTRSGAVLGELLLADPIGRAEFTAQDETVARTMAAVLALHLDRDHTNARFEQRQHWLAEAAELTRDLLAGTHADPLQLIADRIRELASADEVLVARPDVELATIVIDVGSGDRAQPLRGRTLPVPGTLGKRVLETGTAVRIDSLVDSDVPESLYRLLDAQSGVIVALRGTESAHSLLGLARRPGRAPFTELDVELATLFADQVALALEFAENRAQREQLALLEDRDRIARDLHDHVIQRLFGVGLSLQRTAGRLPADEADRLGQDIDDIDATIARIRSTIHRLSGPLADGGNDLLRVHAERLIASFEPALGFRPDLELLGPLDYGLDADLVHECSAVLREGLANVVRHAGATRASLRIELADARVTLTIRDDGRGVEPGVRRSGLANLLARAELRGGDFEVAGRDGEGTVLRWSVSVDQ